MCGKKRQPCTGQATASRSKRAMAAAHSVATLSLENCFRIARSCAVARQYTYPTPAPSTTTTGGIRQTWVSLGFSRTPRPQPVVDVAPWFENAEFWENL